MENKGSPNKATVLAAGTAGGGIGTLLATFADSLPIESSYKSGLTITAPLITIGISGLWLFIKAIYIDPYAATKKHKSSHAHINQLIQDARETETEILNNSNSTEEHKKAIRTKVEELETILMDAIIENVEYKT